MIIRQERSKDFPSVYALVKAAFESAEHADGNEQDLVNALRKLLYSRIIVDRGS